MRLILTTIATLAILAVPALADKEHHHGHNCGHRHEVRVAQNNDDLARAATFRAVCARGDLNQAFNSRQAAAAAAAHHRKQTGHPATVRKQ